MHTAYCIAFFNTKSGTPVFTSTGIFSEKARSLSSAIGPGRFACDVMEAQGDSYEEAKKNLLEALEFAPNKKVFGWALDALENR